MRGENASGVREFILVGFPTAPRLQPLLFALFLLAYVLVLAENAAIVLVVWSSAALHRPMYYFLGSLSFLEICYVSDILPRLLHALLSGRRSVSFGGCMAQLYFFSSLVCSECVLLASMAYDRSVAIGRPLRYPAVMTPGLCARLVAFSFGSGFGVSAVKIAFISRASFCGPRVLNHFFCDISPILKLACADFSAAELVDFALAFVILVFPLVSTVLSYGHIGAAVLRIPSAGGRWKAFSTCASHLSVVVIFYSAMIFMYVRPQAIDSRSSNKLISAVYTVLTPIVNPLIYCLRNQEFKGSLRRSLQSIRR